MSQSPDTPTRSLPEPETPRVEFLAMLAATIQAGYIACPDPHQAVPGTVEAVGLALGFIKESRAALSAFDASPEGTDGK